MDTPKTASQSQPRSIDDLIAECDRLSQPTTPTTLNELAKLQRDAVHYLLRLGRDYDAIREKVEALQFQMGYPPLWRLASTVQLGDYSMVPPSWAAEGRSQALARLSHYLVGVLNELKDLLVIAQGRKKSTAAATRPEDPERLRRWRAIGRACAQFRGSRINIASVCRDLQKDKIKMPQRWLDDWKKKGLRVEQCDWFIAYQNPIAKAKIQK